MRVARVQRDGRTFPNPRGIQPCPGPPEACPAGRSTHTAWCPPGQAMPSGTASEWLPSESPSARLEVLSSGWHGPGSRSQAARR